jgi:DNA-binding winged helix-turn-helix (wHTH) protein
LPLLRACCPAQLVACAQALAATRPASAAIATLLRGGDLETAAQRAEASIELVPALDPESAQLLAELPQSILRSHPRLWLGVGMPRWWHDDTDELVEGATFALDAAPPGDIDTRYGLTLMIFPALIGSGQRERARALVDRLLHDAWASPAPHHPMLAALLEAAWYTFDERAFDIDTVRDACRPLFTNPGVYFVFLVMPQWTWYRIHGRFAEALETCENAIAVARELMPGSYLDALQGAAYTAWIAGNDTRLDELLALSHEALARHDLERSHGFFRAAATADPDADHPRDIARPWAIAEGLLMRAARRASFEAARCDVIEAIGIADRLGFREMVLTGRIALAVINEVARFAHLAEAARIAALIGTRELIAAVDALAVSNARDGACYQPLVRRFEKFRVPRLRLNLAAGSVEHGSATIAVSRQQFAILSHIALAERPISRRDLSERVTSAGSVIPERVLEVQLARLRKKLGANAIVHDGDGYRFGVPFTTDWHDALSALAIVHDRSRVDASLDAIGARIAAVTSSRADRS